MTVMRDNFIVNGEIRGIFIFSGKKVLGVYKGVCAWLL